MLETGGQADVRQDDFRQLYNCPDVDIRTIYRNTQDSLTREGIIINLLSTITSGDSSVNQVTGQYLGLFSTEVNIKLDLDAVSIANNRDFYPTTVILAQSISPKVPGVEEFWGSTNAKNGTAGSEFAPLGAQNWSSRQDFKVLRIQRVLLQRLMLQSYTATMRVGRDDYLTNCVEFDDKTDKGANINTGALFLFAIIDKGSAATNLVSLSARSKTVGFIPG